MTKRGMRDEFGCPGGQDPRGCNADLSAWVRAAKPRNPGQMLVRMPRCPLCGKTILLTVDWRYELVAHEVTATPEATEKGAG